ncbi:hypothetical protein ASG81_26060 [Paenibacillus sp. Soil522]|nr:hypothetical protein ASG81_26060 [Paenibacillus sp. Soil522]
MARGFLLFIGLYFLLFLLPDTLIDQMSYFFRIKSYHLEHKMNVFIMFSFFIWLIYITIRLAFLSFRKKSKAN